MSGPWSSPAIGTSGWWPIPSRGTPAARGWSLINWVAEIRDESKTDWRWEDWDRVGRKADFVPAFRDWRFDWLDVPRLFRESDRVFEFPMADRGPLAQWSFDRVTLLGDAAHPMYPSGSNGAAQAILDAGALTPRASGAAHGSGRLARLSGGAPDTDVRDRLS